MSDGDKDSGLESPGKVLAFIIALFGTPAACIKLTSSIWPLLFCAPAWQKNAWWCLTGIVWALVLAAALRIQFKLGWRIVSGVGVGLIILVLLVWGWVSVPEYKSREELRTHAIYVVMAEFGKDEDEIHMTGRVREGLSSQLSGLREFAMEPLCRIFHPDEKEKVEDVVRKFQPAILVYGWVDGKGAHTRITLDVEKLRLDEIRERIRQKHYQYLAKHVEENAWAMALPVTPEFALRVFEKRHAIPSIDTHHAVIEICEKCTVRLTSGIALHMAGKDDIAQRLFEGAAGKCPNPEPIGIMQAIAYAAQGDLFAWWFREPAGRCMKLVEVNIHHTQAGPHSPALVFRGSSRAVLQKQSPPDFKDGFCCNS